MKHHMGLQRDPFPLIFAQGNAVTRLACLAFFGLADSPRARMCLLSLIKGQRADGAFPSRFDAEQWGMRETVRNTLLFLAVGLPSDGVNVDVAVRFILRHQGADGGWSENRSLDIPPHVIELTNQQSVTWLTADAVELLRQVELEEGVECQAALAWLRSMQRSDGGWPCFTRHAADPQSARSDPDSTAQIAFLMRDIYGEHDPVYLRGKALFEQCLDEGARDADRGYRVRWRDGKKEPLDGYTLTALFSSWLLDPPRRFQAGYDATDPRVKRMMEALVGIQRDDGGWRPFWADESSPVYTALAVKVLVLAGTLAREDLETAVEAYAV
jgi:hypothetical protein